MYDIESRLCLRGRGNGRVLAQPHSDLRSLPLVYTVYVCVFADMCVTKAKWQMKLIIYSCQTGDPACAEGRVGLWLMTSTHAVILREKSGLDKHFMHTSMLGCRCLHPNGFCMHVRLMSKEVYMRHMADLYLVKAQLYFKCFTCIVLITKLTHEKYSHLLAKLTTPDELCKALNQM